MRDCWEVNQEVTNPVPTFQIIIQSFHRYPRAIEHRRTPQNVLGAVNHSMFGHRHLPGPIVAQGDEKHNIGSNFELARTRRLWPELDKSPASKNLAGVKALSEL